MTGLAAGLGVVFLSSCSSQIAEPAAPNPGLTVELISPSQQTWPDVLAASGEVAAWQEASIGAEVGGIRLDEVLVNVGDVVKKGQLLARYNEDSLRADLARLDAGVAEADANVLKAQADAARADRLEATDALSQQAIQVYRTQAQVAEAQLASARAQRDAQALKLRYARVVAPDEGVISSRSATVGAVSTTGAELFRLVRRNRLEWRAEVPAGALPRLKPGTGVVVQTLDGSKVTGSLRQLAPTVDTGTRNGMAYVDLPADSGLAAGMYLTGRFSFPSRAALVVPESAIVQRDGNQYLMQVDTEDRVHLVKITTGRRQDQAIELLGTIETAARYVKSGGAFLGEGDLVRVTVAGVTAP
ncbi:MAG: efflux RND transporter periplasmic adaptor subunit [Sinimarinibacterium sp.]|jgi:RND family efflux transporter MFP subunit